MTSLPSSSPCVRFAPSPTGYLHIGGLRAALFNYLFAKNTGGTYLLRIEDTDRQRSEEKYVQAIFSSFSWVDLLPDHAPVFQSARVNRHQEVAHRLLERRQAYYCYCAPEPEQREEKEGEEKKLHKGSCPSENKKVPTPALRFVFPRDHESIEWTDLVKGSLSFETVHLEDFVILRADSTPTYNFVVVIDDIDMAITHVIRGEDHISNTPKQIALYKALGAPIPLFAHLPMILGPSGAKLSKREAATSVDEYKKMGILPDALCNYLVRLGWSYKDQEIFSREELISYFSLEAVGSKGAIFDIQKLLWLNGVYIRSRSDEQLLTDVTPFFEKAPTAFSSSTLLSFIKEYKERASTLVELAHEIDELIESPLLEQSLAKKEDWHLEALEKWWQIKENSASFSAAAQEVCNQLSVPFGKFSLLCRLCFTGKGKGPGIFTLLLLFPKELLHERYTKALLFLKNK